MKQKPLKFSKLNLSCGVQIYIPLIIVNVYFDKHTNIDLFLKCFEKSIIS